MTETSSGEQYFQGQPASMGLVAGVLVVPTTESFVSWWEPVGSPAEERAALEAALTHAMEALSALMASSDDTEASHILAFQVALLEDPHLSEPAFQAIDAGASAGAAFVQTMTAMVAEYRQAEDEYFAARAGDLEDLQARVLRQLQGTETMPLELPPGGILLMDDLSPSHFLSHHWCEGQGIVLRRGSASAHVAMLARSRGVPMLVGLGEIAATSHTPALLDAETGQLCLRPLAATRSAFERRQRQQHQTQQREAEMALQPAYTRDGEAVSVQLNIAAAEELDAVNPAICDGIGLVRTELLFHGRQHLPDEQEQLLTYQRILRWAGERPVTIRTLDAGGDKPIPGLTLDGEMNPFLGLRGIRLCLARPAVFRTQLRALLRASVAGQLRIMIPMVSVPSEMQKVRWLLQTLAQELRQEGYPVGDYALGMMVEVPAAALTLGHFDCDFASIGSNDLVQYLMAAARDAGEVASLADPCEAAVLQVLRQVVEQANQHTLALSLCGDAGADPRVLPHLLAVGLRSFSVPPGAVGRVKATIAGWSCHD